MTSAQQALLASVAAAGATGTTWNPSDKGANVTLSNGNLTAAGGVGAGWVRATTSQSSGKLYFELVCVGSMSGNTGMGLALASASFANVRVGESAGLGWGFHTSGFTWDNGANTNRSAGWTTNGTVIGLAVDFGASKIWWARNNTWIASGNPAAGTSPAYSDVTGTLFPAYTAQSTADTMVANFTSASQSFSPPSGFSAWG